MHVTTHRALFVEESEGLLELGPHGLGVGVLHQELGAQLRELGELDGAGPDQSEMFIVARDQMPRCDWSALTRPRQSPR